MIVGPAFFAGATGGVTLNPSDKHANIALSSGNMVATKSALDAGPRSVRATRGIAHTDSGYFEVFLGEGTLSQFMALGVSTTATPVANFCGQDATSWGYAQDGTKYTNGVNSAMGAAWGANGSILRVAFKNGSVWFGRNATWNGDPAAGTGAAFTGITGTIFPTLSLYRASAPTHQLGFRPSADLFVHGAPSGFLAWEY